MSLQKIKFKSTFQFAFKHASVALYHLPFIKKCANVTGRNREPLTNHTLEIVPAADRDFYSCYFLLPKKMHWDAGPILYQRLKHALVKQLFKIITYYSDIFTHSSERLIYFSGSERYLFSFPDSPSSQTVIDVCIRRNSITSYCPPVWHSPC